MCSNSGLVRLNLARFSFGILVLSVALIWGGYCSLGIGELDTWKESDNLVKSQSIQPRTIAYFRAFIALLSDAFHSIFPLSLRFFNLFFSDHSYNWFAVIVAVIWLLCCLLFFRCADWFNRKWSILKIYWYLAFRLFQKIDTMTDLYCWHLLKVEKFDGLSNTYWVIRSKS